MPKRRQRPSPIGIRRKNRPDMRISLSSLRQRRVTTINLCGEIPMGETKEALREEEGPKGRESNADADRYFDAILDYVSFILYSPYPICTASRHPLFLTLKNFRIHILARYLFAPSLLTPSTFVRTKVIYYYNSWNLLRIIPPRRDWR